PVDNSPEVGLKHLATIFERNAEHWAIKSDPRVVDPSVESPEVVDCSPSQLGHLLGIGHVGLDRQGMPSPHFDFLLQLFDRRHTASRKHETCATFGGESRGG